MELEMVQAGDSGVQLFDFEADELVTERDPGEETPQGPCCDCALGPYYAADADQV
jgi:hypothetical protein